MACDWCGKPKPVFARVPKGDPLCEGCYKLLRRKTAGMPDCPECFHRLYVFPLGFWGFQCGCDLKFTREAAAQEFERYTVEFEVKPERVLFAPEVAQPLRMGQARTDLNSNKEVA
jgi:hypothetical protein